MTQRRLNRTTESWQATVNHTNNQLLESSRKEGAMPKVPQINNKPLKSIYVPRDVNERATVKQKNLLITLHERRKLKAPDLKNMTKGEATVIISSMLNE